LTKGAAWGLNWIEDEMVVLTPQKERREGEALLSQSLVEFAMVTSDLRGER